MTVGTAYFLDGHTESIYSCKEYSDDRVEFTTISGKYMFTTEFVELLCDKSIAGFFRCAIPVWLVWSYDCWQTNNIFDHIELNKELTQSGKTLDSNKEMSVMRKEC